MSQQRAKGAISRQMFNLHFCVGINSFLVKRGSQPKPLPVNPLFKFTKVWSSNSATTEREVMKGQNSFIIFPIVQNWKYFDKAKWQYL